MNKESIYKELQREFSETDTIVLEQVSIHLSQTVRGETDIQKILKECGPLVEAFAGILKVEEVEHEELEEEGLSEFLPNLLSDITSTPYFKKEISTHTVLSKISPEGPFMYLEKEIHATMKRIIMDNDFGAVWAENNLTANEKDLEKLAANYYNNHWDKDDALSSLVRFYRLYGTIIELKKLKGRSKDHSKLMRKMQSKGYIENVNKDVFTNALEKGPLPPKGENKILWTGMPAEAIRFCEHLGMISDKRPKYKQWNDYFTLPKGKPLYDTAKSDNRGGDIIEILESEGYPEGYLEREPTM